jgi:type IV pilus assembly protein PilF
MNLRRLLLIPCLLLVGCVTEGEPRDEPEPELGTAATLNVQLGYEYLRNGKRAEAVQKFNKAIEQDSDNAQARLGLAFVYEQAGDIPTARGHYRDAVARAATDPSILTAWGGFLCRQKEFPAAEEAFLKAARDVAYRTPDVALVSAGLCAREAGDLDRAETHLRDALKANARNGDALLGLADVSFTRGDALRTRAFVERFLADHRPTPRALLLGWRAEGKLGDVRAAQRFADRLRQEFPASAEVRQLGGVR